MRGNNNMDHVRTDRLQQLTENMTWMSVALLLGILLITAWGFLLHQVKNHHHKRKSKLPLPPGPRTWPIVGCLPFLPKVNPPERLMAELAKKHGDLMLLRMGARKIVVVSSARMAREIVKVRDEEFADRPSHSAYRHVSFNDTMLVTMSVRNPLFKPTRRMFAVDIMAPRKVAAAASVRKEQVVKMVRVMVQDLDGGRCVNLTKAVSSMAMNLALCMAFGTDCAAKLGDETDTLVRKFHKIIHLVIRSSYGNYGDFFPALRWLDVQGIEAGFLEAKAQLRESIMALIEKKKQEMSMWSTEEIQSEAHERDIMSKLLSVQGEDRFSEDQLVSVVYLLLIAGTDSIYKAITEAIHEVVRKPYIYKQALDKLDTIVGMTSTTTTPTPTSIRLVEEADIPKLPFIHNIVKETLRLHPPAPTFPFHSNMEPSEVGGYYIPAQCSVVINLPPIMRDPTFWELPSEFLPDRFNHRKMTPQGSDFNFIPFGYGKRQCPAISLSMTTVQYVVAVCLQCIEWQIPDGLDRSMDVGTSAEPRKKVDVILEGKLRVERCLLETNATP